MHAEVIARAATADVVIMAAAVADYSVTGGASNSKIEKGGPLMLTLERTPDILAELGSRRQGRSAPLLVGFAAQTGDPVPAAQRKLAAKHVDVIVANDVTEPGAGFEVETNIVSIVTPAGVERLPLMSKRDVAAALLDRVETAIKNGAGAVR
jgi:phosphopantothenoylcysteine decarboxylase/phosphopantothenate--cysteine ligase